MVELAKAYIQVIPSMKDARKEIERELGGNKIGRKAGIDFSNGFSGAARSMGRKVVDVAGKTIKTGLVAGAAVTGGLMATAINKGFGRLSAIEQATKSLEGMGLSAAEVATVMDNATVAVTGTAFGLDAAATAARGLVAAGVEPGEELERVLTLVGDSAAQAGTSMDEMGVIWQKVAAKGKLQGDEALQLMERGIPIYQMVADQLGITAEEAMKLGTEGKISFEMFATAMEESFGGTALAMGDTVRGSFANTGAALGRLGEQILKGPFADMPAFFQAVTREIDAIAPAFETAATKTYNAAKGVWEILAGKGYSNALADAFGEINASKIIVTLHRVRTDFNVTKVVAATAIQSIHREFLWLDQAATLDNLLGAVERGSDLMVMFADGSARLATALAPAVSYAAQAATILGGGILDSVETLAPVAFDLAIAFAEAGSAMSSVLVPGAAAAVAVLEPATKIFADLLGWVADLPDPVLTAGAAFLMLKTNMGPVPKLAGALKTGFDKAKDGAETLAIQAMVTSDATGKVGGSAVNAKGVVATAFAGIGGAAKGLATTIKTAFATNPFGIALIAATAAFSFFTSQSEKAKTKVNDLADTFDELGNVTEATREKIYDNLVADENWFGLGDNLADRFREAGFEISDVIDAVAGDARKLQAITDELELMALAAEDAGNPQKADRFRDMGDALRKQADDTDAATAKSKEYRDAMANSADAVRAHADQVQRQIDVQRAANDLFAAAANKALSVREAERAYQDTLERSRETIESVESSERDRQAALDDIATSTHRLAQNQNDANASQSVLNATVAQGREDFINLATETVNAATGMNYTAEEAAALADELGLIEGTYTANVEADTAAALAVLDELVVSIDDRTGTVMINGNPVAAQTKLSDLVDTIDAETGEVIIDGNRFPADATVNDLVAFIGTQAGTVDIDGNDVPADAVLAAVLTAINNGEESVTINGKDHKAQDLLALLRQKIRGSEDDVKVGAYARPAYMEVDELGRKVRNTHANIQVGADGSGVNRYINGVAGSVLGTAYINIKPVGGKMFNSMQADGSVLDFYGGGGIREQHVAQIAPAGAWRVWAEEETGGEAYIPLAPSKRSRSEAILAEVARRFGYQLEQAQRYADGGTFQAPSTAPTAAGGFPQIVTLEIEGARFTAWVKEKASELPAIQAVNELADGAARFRKARL